MKRRGLILTAPMEAMLYLFLITVAWTLVVSVKFGNNPVLANSVTCGAGALMWGPGGAVARCGGAVVAKEAAKHFGGNPGDIGYHHEGSKSARELGTYPNLIMKYQDGSGDLPMREKIQRYLYCQRVAPSASCSDIDVGAFKSKFREAVTKVIPDRMKYQATLLHDGTIIVQEPGAAPTFEASSSVYQIWIPLPGGDRAVFRLEMGSLPGGYRWSQ